MTDEAKQIIETLKQADKVFDAMELPEEEHNFTLSRESAMILIAEIERLERERDAAVKHLLECHKTICPTCIHHTGAGCDKNANAGVDEAVIFCVDYEWCGFVR